MIEAFGLCKNYGQRVAAQDVSFTVGEGETVALLGKNGAGKTTVMRMLTCFMPPSAGTAQVAGFDLHRQTQSVRRSIGYLPEVPPVYPGLPVREYLGFAARLKRVPRAEVASRVAWAMEKTAITPVADRLIGHLSKGYRQRVGLAQALVNRPKVLILDEPTVGMDPTQIIEIRELIQALKGESTIMLSTHILEEASAVCDRIVIIHEGCVAAQGTFEELRKQAVKDRRIHLLVKDDTQPLVTALKATQGVVSVDENPELQEAGVRRLTVHTSSENDLREALFLVAAKSGARVLGFLPEKASLEDIFLNITQAQDEKSAAAQEAP